MNWLEFLHKISNNDNMAWMPLGIFISITLIGMLYGFAMGWIGAIAMLVWNYVAYVIFSIFIGSFTSLLSAYQVSEYLPEYILEPMIIGIWLLIANLIGYFIMFLLKGKITSRMAKYKESNVSVWQDRIIGSGIMVVATLPVSIFGASIIAVAGDETGASAEMYGVGLRGISFGRYDGVAREKEEFNDYFELISDEEATALFLKLLVMDQEWLNTKYTSDEDAYGNSFITGFTEDWLADVETLNKYRDNIESIINNVDLANHFIDQIYNIADDREIEITRKSTVNSSYDPDYELALDENPDYELVDNPYIAVLEVSDMLFGTEEGQINGYNLTNTGILNLQDFININLIDFPELDKAIESNSDLLVANRKTYIEGYISTYLQAFAHVEDDEN